MKKQEVENFFSMYQGLNANNLETLERCYTDDIQFVDPLHKIQGLEELKRYFAHMYKNVIDCQFKKLSCVCAEPEAFIEWTMNFRHRSLNGGKNIEVCGVSKLVFRDDKICFHQDYFDLSEFIFDQLPLVRTFSKVIKKQAAAY